MRSIVCFVPVSVSTILSWVGGEDEIYSMFCAGVSGYDPVLGGWRR